jgi:hypothetical protein
MRGQNGVCVPGDQDLEQFLAGGRPCAWGDGEGMREAATLGHVVIGLAPGARAHHRRDAMPIEQL